MRYRLRDVQYPIEKSWRQSARQKVQIKVCNQVLAMMERESKKFGIDWKGEE